MFKDKQFFSSRTRYYGLSLLRTLNFPLEGARNNGSHLYQHITRHKVSRQNSVKTARSDEAAREERLGDLTLYISRFSRFCYYFPLFFTPHAYA